MCSSSDRACQDTVVSVANKPSGVSLVSDPVFVVGKEVRLRTVVLLGIVGFVALLVGG